MGIPDNPLVSFWKALKTNNSFVQNSAYMFSASAWAIVIQVIFSPILSRIYDPSVYGLFAVFNSVIVVAGIFSTMGYNRAFVLPASDMDFKALMALAWRWTIVVVFLVTGITLFFSDSVNAALNVPELGRWMWLAGPALLMLSGDRIVMDWSIRVKAFKKQSVYSIPITLGSKSFNALYGWLVSNTVEGLIYTTILNYLVRIYFYLTRIIPNSFSFLKGRVPKETRKKVANDYREYPRFIMLGNALNTLSSYLPVLVLPILLGSSEASGLFVYATLLLDLPARLLGSGISPVFLQKSAEVQKRDPGMLGIKTWQLYRGLALLVVVPLGIFYLIGTPLYEWVFGENWSQAGTAAEVLSVYFFYRLIGSPISSIFNVLRKERQLLHFQIVLFILRLLALVIGGMYTSDFIDLIIIFSVANGLAYFILCIWVFVLLRYSVIKVIAFTLATHGIVIFLAHLLKSNLWG